MYSMIQYQESMQKTGQTSVFHTVGTALPLSFETEDVVMRMILVLVDLSSLSF